MLLNFIKHQRFDVDKICRSIQIKVWITINKREKVGIKKLKNPKAFIDYSQTIDNVYESFEDYNATKKKKSINSVWLFGRRYGIWWKIKSYSRWIFLKGVKLSSSLFFISQFFFKVHKICFIMKIPNKREL